MYFISTIVLSILLMLSITVIFYAMKRINQYEDLFLQVSDTVDFIQMKVDQLDEKGIYKGDDEVGFFWEEVVKLSGLLGILFEQVYEEGEVKDAPQKK